MSREDEPSRRASSLSRFEAHLSLSFLLFRLSPSSPQQPRNLLLLSHPLSSSSVLILLQQRRAPTESAASTSTLFVVLPLPSRSFPSARTSSALRQQPTFLVPERGSYLPQPSSSPTFPPQHPKRSTSFPATEVEGSKSLDVFLVIFLTFRQSCYWERGRESFERRWWCCWVWGGRCDGMGRRRGRTGRW